MTIDLVPAFNEEFTTGTLPKDFQYGFATAAWQIEGGWDQDGRGPCVWDDLAAKPGYIANGDNGHVAANSYNLWREDVRVLKELGAKVYRFSVSWSRVIPKGGRADEVNEAGIAYYSNLVDALLEAGIEPCVTIFHWDLPSALEARYGGWSNREIVADFEAYSRLLFSRLGDRVKHWITINEPFIVLRNMSRGVKPDYDWEIDTWRIPGHMILAHAAAVKAYRDDFTHQGGDIGICLNCDWFEPLGDSAEAQLAPQARRDTYLGLYADPIYLGRFPQRCIDTAGDRLPQFTDDEWAMVKGSSDVFYLNSYSTHWFTGEKLTDETKEMYGGYVSTQLDSEGKLIGEAGQPGFLKIVPWGFRNIITYIHNRYLKPTSTPLVISENGFSIAKEATLGLPRVLDDTKRIDYFRAYIGELVKAVNEDGVDVRGYYAWSLLDNIEWMSGFECLFGSVFVDRENGHARHIKKSGYWLKEYFEAATSK
ncbi:Beta-glucosidase 1B [Vanrija pseudolonga]|uniref:beta-glucosidase n=1 Tax=Vanrija pseudolonga TaxID=143232 RepID=A0AAF1BPF9_9TREE|nr:Beta-glucosidase 1B [Vanrija pseudolonga]